MSPQKFLLNFDGILHTDCSIRIAQSFYKLSLQINAPAPICHSRVPYIQYLINSMRRYYLVSVKELCFLIYENPLLCMFVHLSMLWLLYNMHQCVLL